MTAISIAALRQGMRTNLFTYVTNGDRYFLPEGRLVDAAKDEPGQEWWISEFVRPLTSTRFPGGGTEETGQCIYRVLVPIGRGTEIAEAKTLEILEAFEAGKPVSVSGAQVLLDHPIRGGAVQYDSARWAYPVTINWRLYTA